MQRFFAAVWGVRPNKDNLNFHWPNVGSAIDMFSNPASGVSAVPNGTTEPPPIAGDAIVFDVKAGWPDGHVGIITAVSDGYVWFMQQNEGDLGKDKLPIDAQMNIDNSKTMYPKVRGWLSANSGTPVPAPKPPPNVAVPGSGSGAQGGGKPDQLPKAHPKPAPVQAPPPPVPVPAPAPARPGKPPQQAKPKQQTEPQQQPPPPPVPAPVPAPPPPQQNQPTPTLQLDRAFTTDGTTHEKTAFHPGDNIWYVVSMHVTNGPARATIHFRATGPRVLYDTPSSPSDVNSGYQAPYAPATIPSDAPSGTYTLTAYVAFDGSTTTRTSTFTVTNTAQTQPQPAPKPKLAPYASLSPYMGPPGTVVNASGGGWAPNKPVTVTQSGSNASGGGGTITADSNGDIDGNFKIADNTQPGTLTITFRQGSSTVTVHFEVE